jgi:hypothetical protein
MFEAITAFFILLSIGILPMLWTPFDADLIVEEKPLSGLPE